MALRRRFSSVAFRLGRASTVQRHLHQTIPALQLSSHTPYGRATQSRPLLPLPPSLRQFATSLPRREKTAAQDATNPAASSTDSSSPDSSSSESTVSKIYSYEDIVALTESADPNRILIDVREPSELNSTGRIPTSVNIPIQSSPDFAHLGATEFEDRFGFPRPSGDQEVVFYCKSGVRSRAAARFARQGEFGGRVGEFPGSWAEWSQRGGKVERGGGAGGGS